ncbi:hypothetical protein STACA0001_0578 [Staphylococcus capitis SK14]|nr:hypothetical protein STACA0001_0578 [Staphylococcus capitis SK14]EGS39351.1 hypothetical protein SEVCU116_1029 [Staphylococcus capitis VCU116]
MFKENHIFQSMSKKGNWLYNFYNNTRIKSKNKDLFPKQYWKQIFKITY